MRNSALDTTLALLIVPLAIVISLATFAWFTVLPAIGLLWLFGWLQ